MWLLQYTIAPFLRALHQELGYPMDIGKLKDLLAWLENNDWELDSSNTNSRLYLITRCLFLQKQQHEKKFAELFKYYCLQGLLYAMALEEAKAEDIQPFELDDSSPTLTPKPLETNPSSPSSSLKAGLPEAKKSPYELEPKPQYLNIFLYRQPVSPEEAVNFSNKPSSKFLFTDDFLPLSYREMVQSWRYLRQNGETIPSEDLDIMATVSKIAETGFAYELVYCPETNPQDSHLIILADRRGSMAPFHHLSDQIIAAASGDTRKRRVETYYFYNCPNEYVYAQANLSRPLALKELYAKMLKKRTQVMIISDAGAAKGNLSMHRFDLTKFFLNGSLDPNDELMGINRYAHSLVWLNPMPRHRWINSMALEIDKLYPKLMYPLLEAGKAGFLQGINALMGKI